MKCKTLLSYQKLCVQHTLETCLAMSNLLFILIYIYIYKTLHIVPLINISYCIGQFAKSEFFIAFFWNVEKPRRVESPISLS